MDWVGHHVDIAHWGVDLDNAFVPGGEAGYFDANGAQYAIAVANPPDAPLPATVDVWYKEGEVEKVRLKNISHRTTLKKLQATLKKKEELAQGLPLIDFEQLKIENQTLNEKIEELNELLRIAQEEITMLKTPGGNPA